MTMCRKEARLNPTAMCIFFLATAATTLFAAAVLAEETMPPAGRIVGTVTVQGTNEPVAGALIRVLTDRDQIGLGYSEADATSDANGRYVLKVPIGNAMFNSPVLPSGYWAGYESYSSIATTPKQPEYSKHYVVHRGPMWRVVLDSEEMAAALLPDVMIVGSRFTAEPHVFVETRVDDSGVAKLTLPEAGGKFQITFYELSMRLVSRTPATLSVEPGFQPHRVVSANRNQETAAVTFLDAADRRATLTSAEGTVVDGHAEIHIAASLPSAHETFDVTGLVVDAEGRPLADAAVTLGSGNEHGSAMSHYHARTDKSGRFTIPAVVKALYSRRGQQLFVVARHDGFAGAETDMRSLSADADDAPFEIGTITLHHGHEVRLRVADADGQPVLGAWVEPVGNYAARAQFARTNADGVCTLRNLSAGIQKVDIRFGDRYASTTLVVLPQDMEETLVRLRPLPQPTSATAATEKHNPLAVGEEAPDWEVVGWTDGAERHLSDFRGKVVVIDFWGVWCSACINAIPGMKEVHKRFRGQDVVFLGIHTAGTDITQARKLLELKQWDIPTGLDTGVEIFSGATVQRYHVRGYPTTVIFGRDGKVVFNTDAITGDREAVMTEMEQIAHELDMPWPFPKDLTPEEGISMLNSMLAHRLSKHIEAALREE
jgi:thiol-disulfide isomerase/thioredoxin